jgi:hypothetical protein
VRLHHVGQQILRPRHLPTNTNAHAWIKRQYQTKWIRNCKGLGRDEGALGFVREVGHVEGVDLARAEGLIVAGDVIEGGEREVVEDEVAIQRVGVEPQLVAEADPRHVRARRGRERRRAVRARGRRQGYRRRRHRRGGGHSVLASKCRKRTGEGAALARVARMEQASGGRRTRGAEKAD